MSFVAKTARTTLGLLALVLVAGCGRIGFDPIGAGPADAAARDAGSADAAAADAAAADGSRPDAASIDGASPDAARIDAGGPRWPNMPPGCAVLSETGFGSFTEGGWEHGGATDVRLDADATAPLSPASVVQFVFPVGLEGGFAPGSVFYLSPELQDPIVRDVYVGLMWKASDPWETHPTGANGIFLVHRDDAGAAVFHGLTMQGDGVGPYSLECEHEGTVLVPNLDDVPVTLGEWHLLELRHRLSTTETSGDGLVEWFMDGMPIGRYTNVNFTQAPHESIVIRPIWGGVGGTKSREDYYWFDHAVVCVND